MFNDPMFIVALLIATALLLHVILFGRITKQQEGRIRSIGEELENKWRDISELREIADRNKKYAHEWMERFKGLEELAAETGEKQKKQIAELKDELKHNITIKEALYKAVIVSEEKMRTAWAVHQVVTVYGKPRIVCLSAVVFAENAMRAKIKFFDSMKTQKQGMKIRSVAPIQANKVFPNT